MKKAVFVLSLLGLFAVSHAARAAAPPYMPVQGYLTDTAGTPIDETVTAVFTLYTTDIGSTGVWSETQNVLVEDGLFVVYLGDVTSLDLSLFRDNEDLWLGIQIGGDPEMPRVYLGSNPFSAYAEYCGTVPTHSHTFGDLTGTVPPTSLPAESVLGPQACTGTDKVSSIDSSGGIVCTTDDDTLYSNGAGLLLTGTAFSVDTSVIQARVTGTCSSGEAIQTISDTGAITCETVSGGSGDITEVNAGTGLTGGGLSGPVTLDVDTSVIQARVTGSCTSGQAITSISGTGGVTCAPVGTGDITEVNAGTGLTGGGTSGPVTLDVDTTSIQERVTGTCSAGFYINQINADGSVVCAADAGGSGALPTHGWDEGRMTVGITGSCVNALSASVTVGGPGTVYVYWSADISVNHTAGTDDLSVISVGTTSSYCSSFVTRDGYGNPLMVTVDDLLPTGGYMQNVSSIARFPVASLGTLTYYLNGYDPAGAGNMTFYQANMNAVWFPD
jgi:hypothetical protein